MTSTSPPSTSTPPDRNDAATIGVGVVVGIFAAVFTGSVRASDRSAPRPVARARPA